MQRTESFVPCSAFSIVCYWSRYPTKSCGPFVAESWKVGNWASLRLSHCYSTIQLFASAMLQLLLTDSVGFQHWPEPQREDVCHPILNQYGSNLESPDRVWALGRSSKQKHCQHFSPSSHWSRRCGHLFQRLIQTILIARLVFADSSRICFLRWRLGCRWLGPAI